MQVTYKAFVHIARVCGKRRLSIATAAAVVGSICQICRSKVRVLVFTVEVARPDGGRPKK